MKKRLLLALIFSLLVTSSCNILPKKENDTESTEESTRSRRRKKKKKENKENETTESSEVEETTESEDKEKEVSSDFDFIDVTTDYDVLNPEIEFSYQNNYDKLILNTDKYPKLSKIVDSFNDESKEFILSKVEENGYSYASNSYDITRADNHIFSIMLNKYHYNSSTESTEYELKAITYNSLTTKEIALSDILKDTSYPEYIFNDSYLSPITSEVEAVKTRLKSFFENIKDYDYGSSQTDHQIGWSLGYNGIVIHLYAKNTAGNNQKFSFELPYSKYPQLYNEKYFKLPKNYAFKADSSGVVHIDIDNDKHTDDVSVIGKKGDTEETIDSITSFAININGTETEISSFSTDNVTGAYNILNPTVYVVDDKKFLLFETYYDNDYTALNVIDLEYPTSYFRSYIDEGISFSGLTNFNPKKLKLGKLIQTVSTLHAVAEYEIYHDGSLKMLDNYYTVSTDFILTSKVELPVEVISEDRKNIIENKNLSIGSVLKPIGTDCETYTDFRANDGNIVRIYMQKDAEYGGYKINGMQMEDVFDGVVFAG